MVKESVQAVAVELTRVIVEGLKEKGGNSLQTPDQIFDLYLQALDVVTTNRSPKPKSN
jgi:hypothetical protein